MSVRLGWKSLILLLFVMHGGESLAQTQSLQGPNVIRAPIPEGFQVESRFLRTGTIDKSGVCEMGSKITVARGETKEEIEIEYDPQTCRSIVVQGKQKPEQK